MRFADGTAIIDKTQEETGRKYFMQINIETSQVMSVPRRNKSLRI